MPSASTIASVPGGTRISRSSPSLPWRSDPSPWPPRRALKCDRRLKALEVAQRVVAHEHDVAAATTVTAVRPAFGHVRLAAEAEATVATATGLDVDSRAILHGIIVACPIPQSGVNEILVRPASQSN